MQEVVVDSRIHIHADKFLSRIAMTERFGLVLPIPEIVS